MISYEARPGFISFFSDFKHVVFRWKGSVIKACIPQMSISALLSVLVQVSERHPHPSECLPNSSGREDEPLPRSHTTHSLLQEAIWHMPPSGRGDGAT